MKLSNLILENAEAELEDAFNDLEKDIQKLDLDAPESEAIGLTLAGVALSFRRVCGRLLSPLPRLPKLLDFSWDKD